MTGAETPQSLIQQAASFQRLGRLAEAVATYERLLAQWPKLADSWYNLALLQRQIGRFEAALASYQRALDEGARDPEEIHLNRGVIYADNLRKNEAAERELNAALALNPTYVPAQLNFANLKEDQGERDHALAIYDQILRRNPSHIEALARTANLKTAVDLADPLIAGLRQALSQSSIDEAAKASLGFALGKLLDQCKAYDEAFDAYAAANKSSRNSAPSGRVLYDRARHADLVDQLIETFGPERYAASALEVSPPPIFVCGMFRSGSTLVEQVLASHPRVTAGGELDLLPAIVRSELAPFPSAMSRTSPAKLAALAARYRQDISKLFPDADIVTDKRPDNFLSIGLIKLLFPNAKIINTTRNPLDNCLSVYFLHLDHSMGYALDLMDTGHYYRQYMRLMAHWKSLFGADILDFDYDAFVREPKPAVEKLLGFCGLNWDDACMSFHQATSTVKTASVWQVREPLYRRSSGRWQNYERNLASLRADLGDLCTENQFNNV